MNKETSLLLDQDPSLPSSSVDYFGFQLEMTGNLLPPLDWMTDSVDFLLFL